MANCENVSTPWGKSQGGTQLTPGITMYHTASHGGVKVVKKLNNQIPTGFRRVDGWYEEDCDSCIVFYFFYESIKNHMTGRGMPSWSISAEEYFTKFTRAWFKESIERWNIPESLYHLGTIYPSETLEAYGRKKLEQALLKLRRKEQQPVPKPGDTITFDEDIAFTNGECLRCFTFERGNILCTPSGRRVRIRQWQGIEHCVTPAVPSAPQKRVA